MWKRWRLLLNRWHLGIGFLTFRYRCSTMLLRQRKWLRSMSHLPLTFWSGLNKPSSSWTIASLLIPWLGSSSSFRHSTLTAQWRNHLSKGRWLAIVIPKGGELAAAKAHLCSDFHKSLKSESYFPPCLILVAETSSTFSLPWALSWRLYHSQSIRETLRADTGSQSRFQNPWTEYLFYILEK